MMKISLKKICMLLTVIAVLAGCQPKAKETATTAEKKEGPLANKKIALIMQENLGSFSTQYIEGVKEQAAKFGGKVTVFESNGDLSKMASNVDAAINQKFDAILTDHGTKETLTKSIENAVNKKIPVVAFDADLSVKGTTVLEQGDQQMADMTLNLLASDANNKANIVKIWVAGFAPMERRQLAYKAFMDKHPNVKEVASFGSASDNTALDTQSQMEALLKQYPKKGQITAIWASWDEFAKGAVRALQEAGRTDIKVYGIDMTDEDLQVIQEKNSPWVATAAVDPTDIGRVQVRYAYQKLNGETTPATVKLKPTFVKQSELPSTKISTNDLHKYVSGWGASKQGYNDTLTKLEAQ